MGLIGRRRSRPKSASVILAAALFAAVFEVVAVGPRVVNAATCSFDLAMRRLLVTIESGETALFVGEDSVEGRQVTDGPILVRDQEGTTLSCGPASNSNTVSINVNGQDTASETFIMDNVSGPAFDTSISWTINLRSGDADTFIIDASDISDRVTLTDDRFDLNGGGGDLQEVDVVEVHGNGGSDTIDASARSTRVNLAGGDADDVLTGGAGDDHLEGGAGTDRLHGGDGSDTCDLDDVLTPCDPRIEVGSPVETGGTMSLSGKGWYQENGVVELSIAGDDGVMTQLDAVSPEPDWSIHADVSAPSVAGTYTIKACQCSDADPDPPAERETFTFEVGSPGPGPTLTALDEVVQAGDPVVVEGRGWDPNDGPVSLFAPSEYPDGRPFATVPLDTDAPFSRTFDGKGLTEGRYEITACQHCVDQDGAIVRTAPFKVEGTVVGTRILLLSTEQASPGDRIDVRGEGWDRDDGEISIFVEPSSSTVPDAFAPAPDPGSRFDAVLTVPDLDDGVYTVIACQRCDGPRRIDGQPATLTIARPSPASWWWLVLAPVLLLAAIGGVLVHRIRTRRLPPTDRVHARLLLGEPEVHLVEEPDGAPRHTVQLVPHADPGVQRLHEGEP